MDPWLQSINLSQRFADLDLFVSGVSASTRRHFGLYLSPGPLLKNGNAEYTILLHANKLHVLTDDEIKQYQSAAQKTYKDVEENRVVWVTPAANQYYFGIEIREMPNKMALIQFLARPANAVGYNLDLGNELVPQDNVSGVLVKHSSASAIHAHLKKFDGKKPVFLK